MNKLVKRLLTGTLAFATILTALPVTAVHASGNQYWTESAERVGYIEHVMNDGSIKSTFNEGHMKVEGETAYCVDINTNFKNGYKTRSDASTRMSSDQIADVALSLEYVKQGCKYFASLLSSCKAKGMNDINVVIKERLGHEKIQTTLGTYGHLYPNTNLEVAKKLTGILQVQSATESIANYTSNQHTAIYHRTVEEK